MGRFDSPSSELLDTSVVIFEIPWLGDGKRLDRTGIEDWVIFVATVS